MKRKFAALSVLLVTLAVNNANAFGPVEFTPGGPTLLFFTGQFANQLQKSIEQIKLIKSQIAEGIRQLKGAKNIDSWEDFNKWSNRQFYLAKQTDAAMARTMVSIDGTEQSLEEIIAYYDESSDSMTDKQRDAYSKKQQKEIYLKLGMSPTTYSYIQAMKAKKTPLQRNILTKVDTINRENQVSTERNNAIREELVKDRARADDDKMAEKEVAQYSLEVAVDTNETIKRMAYDQAEAREAELLEKMEKRYVAEKPRVSETWNYNPFEPFPD
jgi:hypothetical protein